MLGDASRADKFALEFGNLRVGTIKSVSGIASGQESIEVKQNTPKGDLLIREVPGPRDLPISQVRSGVVQPGQIKLVLEPDQAQALAAAAEGGSEDAVLTISDGEGEAVHVLKLANASVDAEGEEITLTFEDINVE
ncbi:hypothetical protein ACIBBD_28530 [Streptomyces sp. NPDC051315]|uniref:hypothetical protein n=1 Tax=Streptomyces sp. NPDC051315 TaxID=3365650 RepID=UPI00378977E2